MKNFTTRTWMHSDALNGRGPWRVTTVGPSWYIFNEVTKVHKRIGRIGGPKGNGRGINYRDRAAEEAERRNVAYWAKNPPELKTAADVLALFDEDWANVTVIEDGGGLAVVAKDDESTVITRFISTDGKTWEEIGGFRGFDREVLFN